MAASHALGHLLRVRGFAVLAAAFDVVDDVALASPLATTLRASAPHAPLAPLAVLGLTSRLARRLSARACLLEDVVAGLAGPTLVHQDLALATHLPAAAGHAALAPGPFTELTIDRVVAPALPWAFLTGAWVARPRLLRGTFAGLPIALSENLDPAAAPLYAVASKGAATPRLPFGEGAVDTWTAGRVNVATSNFLRHTGGHFPAIVSLFLDRSASDADTTLAAGRANTPHGPFTPHTVDASVVSAWLGVARRDF